MNRKFPRQPPEHNNENDSQTDCRAITRFSVVEFGLDASETALLRIFRCIWISYTQQSNVGWDAAYEQCELTFGIHDGPLVMGRTAAVNRAIRGERNKPFDFMSPFCRSCKHRLSDSEAELFALLKSTRTNDPQLTLRYARNLTQHAKPKKVMQTCIPLAAILMRYSTLAEPNLDDSAFAPINPHTQLH